MPEKHLPRIQLMDLKFERKTNAFDCVTDDCVINIGTCDGGDAAMQINRHGLHTFDRADHFFRVGATMVAGHAFDDISFRWGL